MEEIYDLIIIGAGPAGLSAAIHASNAGINFLLIEAADSCGGQLLLIPEADFPPISPVPGVSIAEALYSKTEELGCEIIKDEIIYLDLNSPVKTVTGRLSEYSSRAVILAMGTFPSFSDIPGENEFSGRGVYYSALPNSDALQDITVAVSGSKRDTVETAVYLSDIAKNVFLICEESTLSLPIALQERMFNIPNITFLPDSRISEIIGEEQVEAAWIENTVTKFSKTLALDAVVLCNRHSPASEIVERQPVKNYEGFINAREDCRTSLELVYAAGDIRTKQLRNIVSAICDGENAVESFIRDFI